MFTSKTRLIRASELKILLAVVTLCGLASAAYPQDCKNDRSCCRPVHFKDGGTKLKGIVFEDVAHAIAKGYLLIESKKSQSRHRCWIGYGNKPKIVELINTKKKPILKYLEPKDLLGYTKGDSTMIPIVRPPGRPGLGLGAHSPASAGSQPVDMNGKPSDFYAPDMPASPNALLAPRTFLGTARAPLYSSYQKAARKKLHVRKQREAGSDSSHDSHEYRDYDPDMMPTSHLPGGWTDDTDQYGHTFYVSPSGVSQWEKPATALDAKPKSLFAEFDMDAEF